MLTGGGYTFQQDGAASHTAKSVTKWIKDEGKFPILPWRPNGPDLNPLGYAARGILERRVSDANPETEVGVRCATRKAVAEVNPGGIKKSALQLERWLDMCIANNGRHFENQMQDATCPPKQKVRPCWSTPSIFVSFFLYGRDFSNMQILGARLLWPRMGVL